MTESPRFLKLTDVAEGLNISQAQAYALVRSGDLPAIQIGGRSFLQSDRECLNNGGFGVGLTRRAMPGGEDRS